MKEQNKTLAKIISEISSHAKTGRLNASWGVKNGKAILSEAIEKTDKNKNTSDEDESNSDEQSKRQNIDPIDRLLGGDNTATDNASGVDGADKSTQPKDANKNDKADEGDSDDTEKEASILKAKAEVAKADKAAAEQELVDNSYLKLSSQGGLSFLLQKILDGAFKTNTIDSLAAEFSSKLRITTQDDYNVFSEDMIPYNTIPGMAELLSSIKSKITPSESPINDKDSTK